MREDVIAAAVDTVTNVVLDALERGVAPTADALRFLLRVYASTGRDDVRASIEPALADALQIAADSSSETAAGWLILFVEAAGASDDSRLREAASDLASKVRMNLRGTLPITVTAHSVDAYLQALPFVDDGSVQAPIDELEGLVARSYEPGCGIEGGVEQDVSVASALLTAFAVTDRIPYAMLAEELLRHAHVAVSDVKMLPFLTACHVAQVLSRMAALHQHPEYRTAAVIAPNADYASDAGQMLEQIARDAEASGIAAAAYGLAAGELQSALRWP